VGIHGETDDSPGSAIPADAVNGLDQVAKRQGLLLVIGFHAGTISQRVLRAPWGVDPIVVVTGQGLCCISIASMGLHFGKAAVGG